MSILLSESHNSAPSQNALRPPAKAAGADPAGGVPLIPALVALLAICLAAFIKPPLLHAQEHKSKVPIVGKLSPGRLQQAYSGKIQSVDLKQKILSVNSLNGEDSEIFPIKKNVRVENLGGTRMKVSALTPGSTVLIYYDQKSRARSIKNIIILSSGKKQKKGKSAPSS